MDTVFDVAATHAGTIGGYVRTQRAAIMGANVVTLKDKVIKKLLSPPISTHHWITSFNPKELRNNETNFFSFVGDCWVQTQLINQHMQSFCLHNVFMVVQMGHCQQRNAVDAVQYQLDATGNQVLDASRNPIPEMEDYVQEVGNLFDIWHNLDRMEVLKSCRIYHQHAEDVDQQNLTWSYELLLKNVDSTLQQRILSACENLLEYALSGLFVFVVMAECVMSTMQNLAHNVNSGLLIMSLNYVQNLKNFHRMRTNTPESLFLQVQDQ